MCLFKVINKQPMQTQLSDNQAFKAESDFCFCAKKRLQKKSSWASF
jgi:hypothetical protein